MKTSSLVSTKSWPSLLCTVALALTTLLLPAITPAEAQLLISDFEADEGFTAGQTAGGKAGWTVGNADFTIAAGWAQSGSQSLRVKAGSAGRLDSPIVVDQGFTGVSLWASNPGTVPTNSASFLRFRVVIGEESGFQRILQFQLRYHSLATGPSYGIDYYNWADGASRPTEKYFSKSLFDPTAWNELRFEANFTDLTYSFWIGDTELLSNIPIGGTVTENSTISQIQFWGHNGTQQGDAYYDRITGIAAIPEPSSLALLGGGALVGLVMLARRRRTA